ncbi:MAG: ABC transporter permease, partial [Bryobacterales bacterium]|nr:ABC transporter permease [Bryobacterales bacterium]
IVAALSTATAMMVSVAIMVGSMRETLLVWIDAQLQADLYIQPQRRPGEGDLPTMDGSVALTVESLPAVDAVDRYRRYAISYGGLPATLALADFRVLKTRSGMRMIEGADWTAVADLLLSTESVIVSETFSSKHDVRMGDVLSLPIGDGAEDFEVVGVYPDYSAESGYILGDRGVLTRHLPDARLTGCGVYLVPGADIEAARAEVVRALAGRTVVVARNRELRENATAVFDRTFAITYALEAVAVFVAILGMAGSLITLVIDRRGELGLLRALGGSREQIRSLVMAQAGMLGIMSNLIGLLLGCALSVILVKVINKQSFGWTIQFHWPVGFLLLAIAVIFAASLAAGLYPARIASSSDPGGMLREA